MRLLLTVLALVAIATPAAAVTIQDGTTFTSPNTTLTTHVGTWTVADPIYWTPAGHFVIDNVEWRLEPEPGATWAFNLTRYDESKINFPGNTTGPGNVTLYGLAGGWKVNGVYAFPAFLVDENETWPMTGGQQNTTLTNFSISSGDTTVVVEQSEAQKVWPYFAILGVGLAFLVAAWITGVPVLSLLGTLIGIAGWLLLRSNQDSGAASPWLNSILISFAILSLFNMLAVRYSDG